MIDGPRTRRRLPRCPPASRTHGRPRPSAGCRRATRPRSSCWCGATCVRRSRWPIEWSVTGKTPRTWCRRPFSRRWPTSGRSIRRAGSAPGSTGSWSPAGSTSGRLGAAEPPSRSMTRALRARTGTRGGGGAGGTLGRDRGGAPAPARAAANGRPAVRARWLLRRRDRGDARHLAGHRALAPPRGAPGAARHARPLAGVDLDERSHALVAGPGSASR